MRPENKDPNERERKPAKKSGVGPFVPLTIGVVIVGGIGLAIMGKNDAKEAAPTKVEQISTKAKPFADMPPEQAPAKGTSGGPGRTMVARAPEGLMTDTNWLKAVTIAAEGEKLWEEATAAKAAGDTAKLNERGKLARDKLNAAFEMTAEWEDELNTKYGDANAEVLRVIKIRTGWIDKVRWLHKSIAR